MSLSRLAYPSLEEINEAMNNHSYIRVSDKRNKNMSIAGIEKFLTEHPNYIYVPSLRLLGTPNDVYNAILSIKALGPNGTIGSYYTPEQAQVFVKMDYNNPNNYSIYNINNPEIQAKLIAEIEQAKQMRKSARVQSKRNY